MQNLPTLYGAYGANTCLESMKVRCPRARSLGIVMDLIDYELVFNGVADVVPAEGKIVKLALWEITPQCERNLDRFEGFRGEDGLYVKRYVEVPMNGVVRRVMIYVMNPARSQRRSLPSHGYEQTLRRGYRDHKMPQSQINRALDISRGEPMIERWGRIDDEPKTATDPRKPGPVKVFKPTDQIRMDEDYVILEGKRYRVEGGGK